MSRPSKDLPERLLTGDATEFERRMLDAALEKRPSAAASARMAKALGVTVTTVGTAAAAKALAGTSTSKAAASAAATTWPWISAGLLGLVVAGAVVGTHVRHAAPPELAPTPTAARALAEPGPAPTVRPAARAVDPAPTPVRAVHRGPAIAAAADLRDEIAVVDAARAAVSAGDARGALEIVRRYEARHASGVFHPEATAIKIEALMNVGRETEARSLALKFVAEQRGTLLANRVADLVGLASPTTNH